MRHTSSRTGSRIGLKLESEDEGLEWYLTAKRAEPITMYRIKWYGIEEKRTRALLILKEKGA
jgi:hypothetical protein